MGFSIRNAAKTDCPKLRYVRAKKEALTPFYSGLNGNGINICKLGR